MLHRAYGYLRSGSRPSQPAFRSHRTGALQFPGIRMSPAPTARDPPLVFRGMACGLDLRTPVVTPIGYPATSVCYPLESSRIAGTQNVATSTPLLMPSGLPRSTSVHGKVNPYAFAWLPSRTRLLHRCRAVRSAPRTMSVAIPRSAATLDHLPFPEGRHHGTAFASSERSRNSRVSLGVQRHPSRPDGRNPPLPERPLAGY